MRFQSKFCKVKYSKDSLKEHREGSKTYSFSRSRWDFLFEKERFLVSGSTTHGPARSYNRCGLPRI